MQSSRLCRKTLTSALFVMGSRVSPSWRRVQGSWRHACRKLQKSDCTGAPCFPILRWRPGPARSVQVVPTVCVCVCVCVFVSHRSGPVHSQRKDRDPCSAPRTPHARARGPSLELSRPCEVRAGALEDAHGCSAIDSGRAPCCPGQFMLHRVPPAHDKVG